MPVTIRLDDDVLTYFKEHGRFGETYSDVLRRLLPNFASASSQSATSTTAEITRTSYPTLFGHAVTNLVRALGALGWTEVAATAALQRKGITPNPAMVKTQISWGRQWGKRNPHCHDPKRPYGSEPPTLTPGQLTELQEE